MFSTSSPTYPASVSAVASAMQLDIVDLHARADALVVVVDRDRKDLLGALLAHHVLVEELVDALRRRHARCRELGLLLRLLRLFLDDLAAELDALVADVDAAGTGDQAADLLLRLPAERAAVLDAAVPCIGHWLLCYTVLRALWAGRPRPHTFLRYRKPCHHPNRRDIWVFHSRCTQPISVYATPLPPLPIPA